MAVWQNCVDMEVHIKQRCGIEFFHAEKVASTDIHWRLLNFYGNQTGCEHSELIGGTFWQWVTSNHGSPPGWAFNEHSMQALVHSWWNCIANGGDYIEKIAFYSWESALSNWVTVLIVTAVVSMKINRRHYFWSGLCICGPRQFLFTQQGPGKPKLDSREVIRAADKIQWLSLRGECQDWLVSHSGSGSDVLSVVAGARLLSTEIPSAVLVEGQGEFSCRKKLAWCFFWMKVSVHGILVLYYLASVRVMYCIFFC